MLKLSSICLAALVALGSPAAAAEALPAAAMADQAVAARIDASLAPHYKAGAAGATVIVVKDGKTLLRKAYGMADVAKQQAMTPEMSLRLGSITKQFTSTAILMLVDEGKLALSDDITRFFPDYPTRGKKITVEHLLTHTSGIVSYTGKPGYGAGMARDLSVAQMIDSFKNDPLEFEPGSRYRYNNSGYFLLGAIIESISGQPYATFLEQRIFVPLGMTQTAYEGFERTPKLRATGHTTGPAGFAPSSPLSMSQPYAAGALVSTVDDLARWDAAVASGKLLKAASWQRAFTPYQLSDGKSTGYGYGWSVGTLRGAPMLSHGGGIPGFSTFALRLPAEKLYVAVLSNADSGLAHPGMIASKAAAIAIDRPFPQYQPITPEPKALDAFAGVYRIDDKANRLFRRDNGQFVMQRTGRPPVALAAHSATGFFVPGTLDRVEFARNAAGEVTHVTLYQGDDETVNVRTGAALPERKSIKVPAALLDTYAGRYQLAPDFAIAVTREGDKLIGQATGQGRMELFAESNAVFFPKEVDATIRFEDAADGSGAQLVLSQGGRDMVGKKLK